MPLNLKEIASDECISDAELIKAYGDVLSALRERGIIRTKNIVGELGERNCQIVFNESDKLPDLILAPTNSMDIDAKTDDGVTYSVKSVTLTSAKRTGSFHLSENHNKCDKRFDYLLVCILNDTMSLHAIYIFEWELFWRLKSWSSTQKAWFLSLTKKNLSLAKQINE